MPEPWADIVATEEYALFREIVTQNIPQYPDIRYDRSGRSSHRTRNFTDGEAEINISERALARYIGLLDLLLAKPGEAGEPAITAGLLAMSGGDALLQNNIYGLPLLIRGFERIRFRRVPWARTIETLIERVRAHDTMSIVELFVPVAHEIGHVQVAQALAPRELQSDAIGETYRRSYDFVLRFTGEFNYAEACGREGSRLHLQALRAEFASDWFATNAVVSLIQRLSTPGTEFPLQMLAFALLSFPLIMALEDIVVDRVATRRDLQEATLGMQCRYSVIIDSVRDAVKGLYRHTPQYAEVEKVIDETIDEVTRVVDELHFKAWTAMLDYVRIVQEVAALSHLDVRGELNKMCTVEQRLALAQYLDSLVQDGPFYPTLTEHVDWLAAAADRLRTFESITVDGNGGVTAIE
jgi:hypothetical protein